MIFSQIPKWGIKTTGPLLFSENFADIKDPCPVFDGKKWHIYGTGGGKKGLEIFHFTSSNFHGPWIEERSIKLEKVVGESVAAPGVIYDDKKFHMFVQTDCFHLDGKIEYLNSTDGSHFNYVNTALFSLQVTQQKKENMLQQRVIRAIEKNPETGIYDSHPAIIRGQKYLVYSGMSEVGRPDIYLAKSTSNLWDGPWERVRAFINKGPILTHQEVIHHNQLEGSHYEWGLEGAQLIELPDSLILLNAVCFLPEGKYGKRQRIFFAVANEVTGPYQTIGPVIYPPQEGWDCGENGHAAGVIIGEKLELFYQGRQGEGSKWSCGIASIDLNRLQRYAESALYINSRLSTFQTVPYT